MMKTPWRVFWLIEKRVPKRKRKASEKPLPKRKLASGARRCQQSAGLSRDTAVWLAATTLFTLLPLCLKSGGASHRSRTTLSTFMFVSHILHQFSRLGFCMMLAPWLFLPVMAQAAVISGPSDEMMCRDVVSVFDSDDNGLLDIDEFSEFTQQFPLNESVDVTIFCSVYRCARKSEASPVDLCKYYDGADIANVHSNLRTRIVYMQGSAASGGDGSFERPMSLLGDAFAACSVGMPCKIYFIPDTSPIQGVALSVSSRTLTIAASPYSSSNIPSLADTGPVASFVQIEPILDCMSKGGLNLTSGTYTFRGFTMKNCANLGSGGAITIYEGSLNLHNMILADNSADDNGGAVAASSSLLTFTGTTFSRNSAVWNGGALYTDNCGVELDAVFLSNQAFLGNGYYCKGGSGKHTVTKFVTRGVEVACDSCSTSAMSCPDSSLHQMCSSDNDCDSISEYCAVNRLCKACKECTISDALVGSCRPCNGRSAFTQPPHTEAPRTGAPIPYIHNQTTGESCLCPFYVGDADSKLPVVCVGTHSCRQPEPTCPGEGGYYTCSGNTNSKVGRLWYTRVDANEVHRMLASVINAEKLSLGYTVTLQCPAEVCQPTCSSNKTELLTKGCVEPRSNAMLRSANESGFLDFRFELDPLLGVYQRATTMLQLRSQVSVEVATRDLNEVTKYEIVDAPSTVDSNDPEPQKDSAEDSKTMFYVVLGTVCVLFIFAVVMIALVNLTNFGKRVPRKPVIEEEREVYTNVNDYNVQRANPLVLLDQEVVDRRMISAPAPVEKDSSSEQHEEVQAPVTESDGTDLQKLETEPECEEDGETAEPSRVPKENHDDSEEEQTASPEPRGPPSLRGHTHTPSSTIASVDGFGISVMPSLPPMSTSVASASPQKPSEVFSDAEGTTP
eukprot:TRINITY_DN6508_c1_g1_i1.p1 TRINITY_DN6508_c1_g1~~TRINITY_DN6508_c1_g1_i1.p1  ORF type:complete len:902 (+),score=106.78 TRINITY_DN6508_c1_g1_i1:1209-3914(+)